MKKIATLAFAVSAVTSVLFAHARGAGANPFGGAGRGRAQPVRFADGSGSVVLPPGWVLEGAARGAMVARGPNGERAELGGSTFVPARPMPYVANPVQALVVLSRQLALRTHQPGLAARVLEARQIPGSSAAMVTYAFAFNGQPYRGYAYVQTRPMPDGAAWAFFSSSVSAPAAVFQRSFGTMMAMWRTWRINGGPNGGAPGGAAPPMVATGPRPTWAGTAAPQPSANGEEMRKWLGAQSDRNYESNEKFDRYVRDTELTRDPETGEVEERPAAGQHWINTQGDHVEANNPSFDPNAVSSSTWHQTEGE